MSSVLQKDALQNNNNISVRWFALKIFVVRFHSSRYVLCCAVCVYSTVETVHCSGSHACMSVDRINFNRVLFEQWPLFLFFHSQKIFSMCLSSCHWCAANKNNNNKIQHQNYLTFWVMIKINDNEFFFFACDLECFHIIRLMAFLCSLMLWRYSYSYFACAEWPSTQLRFIYVLSTFEFKMLQKWWQKHFVNKFVKCKIRERERKKWLKIKILTMRWSDEGLCTKRIIVKWLHQRIISIFFIAIFNSRSQYSIRVVYLSTHHIRSLPYKRWMKRLDEKKKSQMNFAWRLQNFICRISIQVFRMDTDYFN